MATFKNPQDTNRGLSVLAQGLLVFDRFVFKLSAAYAAGAAADESDIQIGEVPVDCVLVPHLSRLSVPVLDSNGSPTGDYSIGTLAAPALLKAAAAAETAAVLFGEDWNVPAGPVGSPSAPTPIVLHVTNVIATLGTGDIVFEPVFRAWNPAIDA